MHDAWLLSAALSCCAAGMGWLALAMEPHWGQVRRQKLSASGAWRLRILGGAGLASSLNLCLLVDHPSMAALVWVMALAGSALAVALALAWKPACLTPLSWFAGVTEKGRR